MAGNGKAPMKRHWSRVRVPFRLCRGERMGHFSVVSVLWWTQGLIGLMLWCELAIGGGQKYYTWQDFQDPRFFHAERWTQVQENFIKMNDISFIIPNKQKIPWNSIIDRSIYLYSTSIHLCIYMIYTYLYIYMHLTHAATWFWMIFGETSFICFPCSFVFIMLIHRC